MKPNSNTNMTAGLLIIVFAIAMIIFGPLATIWSVNTLFSLSIPYSFDTWIATLLLGAFVRGESILTFKK